MTSSGEMRSASEIASTDSFVRMTVKGFLAIVIALGPQPRSGNGSVTWVQFESDAVGAQPFRSYEGRSRAPQGIKDNYIRLAVQEAAPARHADGEARWVVEFMRFGARKSVV